MFWRDVGEYAQSIHPMLGRVFRGIYSAPAKVAGHILNLEPVREFVRRAHEARSATECAQDVALGPDDADIVSSVKERGFCITTLDRMGLPGTKAMQIAALELKDTLLHRYDLPDRKNYKSLTLTAEDLVGHPDLYRWGLNERLLSIVGSYLGGPAAYDGVHGFYTLAGSGESGIRSWHRDREDLKMIKVAVYHTDVLDHGGPLELLAKGLNTMITTSRFRPMKHEELERSIGRRIQEDDTVACFGKAGTVIFADTASYWHRGRPPIESDRFAVYYHYINRMPHFPFYCSRSGLSDLQLEGLARGKDGPLLEAALWRRRLPLAARLVPRSLN